MLQGVHIMLKRIFSKHKQRDDTLWQSLKENLSLHRPRSSFPFLFALTVPIAWVDMRTGSTCQPWRAVDCEGFEQSQLKLNLLHPLVHPISRLKTYQTFHGFQGCRWPTLLQLDAICLSTKNLLEDYADIGFWLRTLQKPMFHIKNLNRPCSSYLSSHINMNAVKIGVIDSAKMESKLNCLYKPRLTPNLLHPRWRKGVKERSKSKDQQKQYRKAQAHLH